MFAGIKLHSVSTTISSSTVNSGFLVAKAASSVGATNSLFGKTPQFPATTGQAPGAGGGISLGDFVPGNKSIASSAASTVTGSPGLGVKTTSSAIGSVVTGDTCLDIKNTSLVLESTGMVSSPTNEDKFLEKLRLLNTSVSKWINRHLQENPYVDLTPVFNDYFEHLRRISKEDKIAPLTSNSSSQQTLPVPNPSTKPAPPTNSLTEDTTVKPTDATVKPLPSDETSSQEDGEEEHDRSEHPSGEEDGSSPQEEGKGGNKSWL